jgi:hypothetical protein
MVFADLLPYEVRSMYKESIQRDLNDWGDMMASQMMIEMQEVYKFRIMSHSDYSMSFQFASSTSHISITSYHPFFEF